MRCIHVVRPRREASVAETGSGSMGRQAFAVTPFSILAGFFGASAINCFSGGQKLFPAGNGPQAARHGVGDHTYTY